MERALSAAPATAATDLLLAAAALGLGIIRLRERTPLPAPRLWGLGFVTAAAAALAGAIYHGRAQQSPALHSELWTCILVLVGASAGLMSAGAVAMPRARQPWRWLISGLVISAVALAVQRTGLEPAGLNHNAWFHLIQIAALYAFFRASVPHPPRGIASPDGSSA